MKFKFTWGHGVILALASFIIFICYMVFSIEFSKNSFDLVTDDYYNQELNYQAEIDATKNAAGLKEKPFVEVVDYGVKITFPKEFDNQNTQGRFNLYRPNSKGLDRKNNLDLSGENTIVIPAKSLVKGNYIMKLYWEKDKVKYQMEVPVKWN